MGVMEHHLQDYVWWRGASKEKLGKLGLQDVPKPGLGFELADILEQGMGPGLTSSFIEPFGAFGSPDAKDQRLTVLCEDRQYSLGKDGRTLLIAKALDGNLGFDIFIPNEEGLQSGLGPAFLLRSSQKLDSWLLTSSRCEQCEARGSRQCGTRELCRMSHYSERVGEGNAFCMDVELPELTEEGRSSVVCSVCTREEIGGCVLSTRRPRWNPRQKTLTLDFHGRCNMASAKNFQLEAENDSSKVTLLYGKVEANKFVLDYSHPLGMVQAFAAALSASHWK
mmetsp:Transcript_46457/g.86858  ORF Transcript_46457/g.86858 Transcript_46457/m.86858 type:complete len:280 (-) Transcript_46457:166-1005(-)